MEINEKLKNLIIYFFLTILILIFVLVIILKSTFPYLVYIRKFFLKKIKILKTYRIPDVPLSMMNFSDFFDINQEVEKNLVHLSFLEVCNL